LQKFFLGLDAQTRLRQVVGRNPTPTSYTPYRVMPCQVSGQTVARNSWTLAIALMTTKARTDFFTVILIPEC
jgi:hypothetical protein